MAIALRNRVRRLEDRRNGGVVGSQVVQILEAARLRVRAGEHTPLPFAHWPPREELERQAAGAGVPVRLAWARLQLLDWPEPAR